ncbi:MAG TPA: phosphoribosyltransferase family protein [Candidatus Limnocylindria bacterium]|nr:phosphoribosyltransferase family protein [Candidatus Limnocylindria bacterium]
MNRQLLPPHLEAVYEPAAIRAQVAEVAARLDPWAARVRLQTGQHLLAVCILRGGVFFFSDLLQAMSESVEPAFCRCHAYRKGVNGDAAAELQIDFSVAVAGRAVLLVDNICDSGRTLAEVVRLCQERGAAQVCTAVLIHRLREDSRFTPDHTAFTYPGTEWFAGYGLRDGDAAMNFPAVFRVVRTAAAP